MQQPTRRWLAAAAAFVLAPAPAALAADLQRGAALFSRPLAPGLLACQDCHSETPQRDNFGNIFSGRNAAQLIQRAVQNNTGGMAVFRPFLDEAAYSDIAAWLGISPATLDFGEQLLGTTSAPRSVTVAASSKAEATRLRPEVTAPFVLLGNNCPANLPARASCTLQVAFAPEQAGGAQGQLRISHDGLASAAVIGLGGRGVISLPPMQALRTTSGLALRITTGVASLAGCADLDLDASGAPGNGAPLLVHGLLRCPGATLPLLGTAAANGDGTLALMLRLPDSQRLWCTRLVAGSGSCTLHDAAGTERGAAAVAPK